MTGKLKSVITQAEQLPNEDQDKLTETWLITLDESGWDRRFADPQNQEKMQRLAEEALKEHATRSQNIKRAIVF